MTLAELIARSHELISLGFSADTEVEIYLDNLRVHHHGGIVTAEPEEITTIYPLLNEEIRPGYDGVIAIHVTHAEIKSDGESQKDVRVRGGNLIQIR